MKLSIPFILYLRNSAQIVNGIKNYIDLFFYVCTAFKYKAKIWFNF